MQHALLVNHGIVSVSGGDRYHVEGKESYSHSTHKLVRSKKGYHNDGGKYNNRAVDIRFNATRLPREEVISFIQKHTAFKVLVDAQYYPNGISAAYNHIHLKCISEACKQL